MAKTAIQTAATATEIKKDLSFAQRAEQRLAEDNTWQTLEAETNYTAGNMQECLNALGDSLFPTDKQNSTAYQEAIIASLVETINPEIGILDFWNKIGADGCNKVKIVEGHMNFYNEQDKLIDITPYTQPIIFYANSSFYDQRIKERLEKIEEAKRQLEELMADIRKNN